MIDLNSIKGLYTDQSVFLICDGPSFLDVDRDKLDSVGIVTMGVNNSPKTFRPDMWVCVDPPKKFIPSIFDDPSIMKFIPSGRVNKSWPCTIGFETNLDYSPETFLTQDSVNWGAKKEDGGARSVMIASIKILYTLGFKNVFLLGVDFNMEIGKRNYHFNEDTGDGKVRSVNGVFKKLTERFDGLIPYMNEAGFNVYNCNPDSALKSFPFMDIDRAIEIASRNITMLNLESTKGMWNDGTKKKQTHGSKIRIRRQPVRGGNNKKNVPFPPATERLQDLIQMDHMNLDKGQNRTSNAGIVDMIKSLPDHGSMVELGCFRGISTSIFSKFFQKVDTVDRWGGENGGKTRYVPTRNWEDVEYEARERLGRLDNVTIHKGNTVEMANEFRDGSLDFVYVDASHGYESVKKDIKAWMPKLKSTGIMGGHDYIAGSSRVAKAVDEIGVPTVFSDSSWFLNPLKVICVMKSGGDYDADDVYNLKRMVTKQLKIPHQFICYSDVPELADRTLDNNLPGWWSKLEIFREKGPCLFFDLDTAILGNIEDLANHAIKSDGFMILDEWLDSWRKVTWNSSIMGWRGDFSWILDEIDEDGLSMRTDQHYISMKLKERDIDVTMANDVLDGIDSYKVTKYKPETSICCFHGKPRPRQVGRPFWGKKVDDFKLIHVPKTGGTSLFRALNRCGISRRQGHTFASEFVEQGVDISSMDSNAIIRNPYDRLVSAYYFSMGKLKKNKSRDLAFMSDYNNFDDFVRSLEHDWDVLKEEKAFRLFERQSTFVCDEEGKPLVKLWRFEDLHEFWGYVANKYDVADEFELGHTFLGEYPPVDSLYTDETRAIVKKLYEKDFELYENLTKPLDTKTTIL